MIISANDFYNLLKPSKQIKFSKSNLKPIRLICKPDQTLELDLVGQVSDKENLIPNPTCIYHNKSEEWIFIYETVTKTTKNGKDYRDVHYNIRPLLDFIKLVCEEYKNPILVISFSHLDSKCEKIKVNDILVETEQNRYCLEIILRDYNSLKAKFYSIYL